MHFKNVNLPHPQGSDNQTPRPDLLTVLSLLLQSWELIPSLAGKQKAGETHIKNINTDICGVGVYNRVKVRGS